MTPLLVAFVLAGYADPADVLGDVRNALHAASAPWTDTVLTGTAEYRGVAAGYHLEFGAGGRFCQRVDGQLGQTLGCDGKQFWEIDCSGATRRLAFEDADRSETMMLLLTDGWLSPTAPLDRTVEGPDRRSGLYTVKLRLHGSGLEESVVIDPSTWHPKSAELEIAASKITFALSDWRAAGSQKVPFMVGVTEAGLTDTYKVDEARAAALSEDSAFSMPNLIPSDLAFDRTAPVVVESRRAPTGHMLVHPRINGADVGWFILDSGADSMIIDKTVADAQGLPKMGKESVVGVGGVVLAPFRSVSEFTLGPATMRNVNFIELDLGQLSGMFQVRLAGIVGFDFFRRFIVQVNLKRPSVEVDDVANFHLPQGDWSRMEFSSGNPAVQASFEGDHTGWFRLDTGANGTVTFHAPAVEQFHLLDGRKTTPAGMAGVGGTTEARSGTMTWFELGGHRFENLAAVFSQAKIGAFADRYLAGNIGQDLMEPFTVVFDFGGSRVAFVPN